MRHGFCKMKWIIHNLPPNLLLLHLAPKHHNVFEMHLHSTCISYRQPPVDRSSVMPPKKKAPTAAQKDPCCVCCQPITKGKEDALFCIGDCQQWLHRYCAGVSTQCYRNFTGDSTPFLCFACSLVRHKKEIDSLKEAVEVLKGEIATLKSSQSSQALPPPSPALLPGVSPTDPQPGGTIAKTVNTTAPAFVSGSHDRKFNVVIYGVEECPSETERPVD